MEITRNEQKITATQGDSASFEMTLTLALVNRGFVWLTLTRRYKINMYMEFMQNQKPYIDMIYRSFCALICVYRTLCKFVIRIESSAFPCIWIHNCTYLYAITMWFAYFMLKWPAWNTVWSLYMYTYPFPEIMGKKVYRWTNQTIIWEKQTIWTTTTIAEQRGENTMQRMHKEWIEKHCTEQVVLCGSQNMHALFIFSLSRSLIHLVFCFVSTHFY